MSKDPKSLESQKKQRTIKLPFKARPGQEALLKKMKRFTVAICHRGWGKSHFAAFVMWIQALRSPKGLVSFISPEKAQGKGIVWKHLKTFADSTPGTSVNNSEVIITLPNECEIRVFGSDNIDRIRGFHPNYVVIDEVADMPSQLWHEIVRPSLTNHKAGVLFIGTIKGEDLLTEFYDYAALDDEWARDIQPARDHNDMKTSNHMDPAELESIEKSTPPDIFAREYLCDRAALGTGNFYQSAISHLKENDRIRQFDVLHTAPVHTGWDLGFNDDTTIWFFQDVMGEIRIIDYYENRGKVISHYAKVLHEKPYVYGKHYLPHDAGHVRLDTGKSIQSQLSELGIRGEVQPRVSLENVAIPSSQSFLMGCYFRKCPEVEIGLRHLQLYRAKKSKETGRPSDTPVHDEHSHAAAAFQTLSLGHKQGKMLHSRKHATVFADASYDIFGKISEQ